MSLWHKVRGKNVPGNQPAAFNLASYVTPKQLKSLWEPIEVPPYFYPSTFFLYKWGEIAKTSAFHVREGDAYEGKAVLAHNPYKVFDIDDMDTYGHLNSLSEDELKELEKENNKNKKYLDGLGNGKAGAAKRREMLDKNPHLKPYNMKFIITGRKTLAKMMKYGGHFNKAHLCSYELKKFLQNKWALGKGVDFIDPDYTIIEPPKVINGKSKRGKIIFIEFKKGFGKTNTASEPSEAQQLRKAAALATRWGITFWNQIPKIELYFVGARAWRTNQLEFTRNTRTVAINRRSPAQIEANWPKNGNQLKRVPMWIGYPINLLTGRGLADMLHMPPSVVARLTTDQTRAYVLDTPKLAELIDDEYGIEKTERTIKLFENPKITAHVERTTPQWKYDPLKMRSETNFDKDIRKVSKLLGYIKAHRLDLKSPSRNSSQNSAKKTKILDTIKLLITKYSSYVDANYLAKLSRINANYRASGARSTGGPVKTPNMGEAFMSPVLRRRGQFKIAKGQKLRVGNLPVRSKAIAKYPSVPGRSPGAQNIINEVAWKRGAGEAPRNIHIKVKQGNIKIANKERLNRIVKSLVADITDALGRKDRKRFNRSREALRKIIEMRQRNLPANFTPAFRNKILSNQPFTNAGTSANRNRASGSNLGLKSPMGGAPWPEKYTAFAKSVQTMGSAAALDFAKKNANVGSDVSKRKGTRTPAGEELVQWMSLAKVKRPPIP